MSANEIANSIIPEIKNDYADFICLNFANPDMVGHTGNFNAAVQACEAVDQCTKQVVEEALKKNYSIIIIADHGNSDIMVNNNGTPNTAHTTNPVPIIILDKDFDNVNNGILADVAPTILKIMGIEKPSKMTGKYRHEKNYLILLVILCHVKFKSKNKNNDLIDKDIEYVDLIGDFKEKDLTKPPYDSWFTETTII